MQRQKKGEGKTSRTLAFCVIKTVHDEESADIMSDMKLMWNEMFLEIAMLVRCNCTIKSHLPWCFFFLNWQRIKSHTPQYTVTNVHQNTHIHCFPYRPTLAAVWCMSAVKKGMIFLSCSQIIISCTFFKYFCVWHTQSELCASFTDAQAYDVGWTLVWLESKAACKHK